MVSLVLKSSFAHRGIFRDKIREWVAAELDAAVEDEPETVYESKNGDVRSFKSEDSVIISNYIKHLFRSYLYLDSNRTLCVSPPPRRDCTSLIYFYLGSQGGECPQLPAPPAGGCSSIQHTRFPEGAPSLSHHQRVQEDEPVRRRQRLDALDRRNSPLTRRLRWDNREYPRSIFFVNSLTYGQIRICYQEWDTGEFAKIKLTNDDHYNLFYDISERINADFLDVRYKEAIRARFRKWARSSNMVLV